MESTKTRSLDTAITIRLPRTVLPRIDEVLKGGEIRSRFIRQAVLNEIELRKKAAARRKAA